MDMTRDFLNGILALDVPNEIDYSGRKWVDKKMNVLPQEAVAAPHGSMKQFNPSRTILPENWTANRSSFWHKGDAEE